MIKAYINCVDLVVVIHQKPDCASAKVGPDKNIRHVLLNSDFLSRELARFRDNKYRFAAAPDLKDMWLILDFQDSEFEVALVRHLKRVIGTHCGPIKSCEVRMHC